MIHGNMDAGTFVFELNGVRWVVDPGNQSYYPLNKIGQAIKEMESGKVVKPVLRP